MTTWSLKLVKFNCSLLCCSRGSFMARSKSNFTTISSPSIDHKELDKFRSLATKWWSGPEFLLLRKMNKLRVPFILDAFDDQNRKEKLPLAGIHLLDVGCGGGILSHALARLGAQVTSLDPVEENIKAAQLHAAKSISSNVPNYICSTIEDFAKSFRNTEPKFDGVIASEVLEHVKDLESFLVNSLSCLRPGGRFIVTTINQTLFSYLTAIQLAENLFGWVPKGTHEFSKFIPPKPFSLILSDFGCDVLKVHGMGLDPLTLNWFWTRTQWANYALLAVKR